MKDIDFVWDDSKYRGNQKKHGVAFEEAMTAFTDENARVMHDREHSDDEDRFVLLGFSAKLRLLVVCHTYRKDKIRIISARRANKKERNQYGELL